MNAWGWLWVGWLAYFGVVEAAAVVAEYRARKRGERGLRATLSRHAWWWFGINDGHHIGIERDVSTWARARRVALGAFLLWLSIHFLAGGAYF